MDHLKGLLQFWAESFGSNINNNINYDHGRIFLGSGISAEKLRLSHILKHLVYFVGREFGKDERGNPLEVPMTPEINEFHQQIPLQLYTEAFTWAESIQQMKKIQLQHHWKEKAALKPMRAYLTFVLWCLTFSKSFHVQSLMTTVNREFAEAGGSKSKSFLLQAHHVCLYIFLWIVLCLHLFQGPWYVMYKSSNIPLWVWTWMYDLIFMDPT